MKTRTRALAATTIGAVALSTAVAVAPTATAAPNSYAYSAARWLEDQLTGGIVHNAQYDFDDYGLSLDVYFTLHDLDTRAAAQGRIIEAVTDHVTDYVTFGDTFYPGSGGKLAVAVKADGGDPTDVGGTDLIAGIESVTDDVTGESTDTYGGVGQAWATRGLIAGGSTEAAKSVDFLLSQQCANGSFKQNYASACPSTVEVDATAFAIEALLAAKAAGQTGLDDEIGSATAALLAAQAQDGSFIGDGVPNTNSTGKAAKILALVGQSGAAGSAAAWVAGHQVTDAVAEDSALATEPGAIAYDVTALTAGKSGGITDETRDQWIRATAQAAAGVQGQLPATAVAVAKPSAFTAAGGAIAVKATGLLPGEKYTAAIAGGAKVVGTVPASGTVSTSVKAPAGTATRTITVTGSRTNRSGSTAATVLAAKKVGVKVAKTKVKRTKVQTVKATGLVAKEPVTVSVRGKVVRKGTATASGTYTYRFKVGTKVGKAKVVVKGAFANRNGTKTFTVVK